MSRIKLMTLDANAVDVIGAAADGKAEGESDEMRVKWIMHVG
jgi:hypothetical protein